jgi:hypothetical protein
MLKEEYGFVKYSYDSVRYEWNPETRRKDHIPYTATVSGSCVCWIWCDPDGTKHHLVEIKNLKSGRIHKFENIIRPGKKKTVEIEVLKND